MKKFSSPYEFGFSDKVTPFYSTKKGLSEAIVKEISSIKKEPLWMLEKRISSFHFFKTKKMPVWGPDLNNINLDNMYYYSKPTEKKEKSWKNVSKEIKNTFDKIGVPEAEKKFLAGLGAQYDSETIYHNLSKRLSDKGVIFLDTDSALKKYPQFFKEYFGKVVPPGDNKFSALNSAVWSGGSFLYVPTNVKIELPLQAYFRINAKNLGQFERTLIIADEGSYVHYAEGCTAPIYSTDSLHCGVVEVIVKKNARVKYTTVQNWSKNVFNLVTKRMFVEEGGSGEWVDANIGSKITMKYPSIYLKGKNAKGELLSLSLSSVGQNQDTGGKIIHLSPNTSSRIISKSIGTKGSITTFRGLVKVLKKAENCKSKMSCHTLLLDKECCSKSFPSVKVFNNSSKITHEAVVSSIENDQLFYLQSRGISKENAEALIVNGFTEQITKEFPLEYSIELSRLIKLELND